MKILILDVIFLFLRSIPSFTITYKNFLILKITFVFRITLSHAESWLSTDEHFKPKNCLSTNGHDLKLKKCFSIVMLKTFNFLITY